MSLFSARVYWFEWRILKKLPGHYAHKVASLLHIKIPITPPALAGSLLMMAGGIAEKLLNTPEIKEELNPRSEQKECDLAGELLRAFYCLAVAILGNDEFASDSTEYNFYTAATYEKLREIMPEHNEAARTVSKKMMDEATFFYLNDKPSLAEYAETMQDYRSGQELERTIKKGDWFSQFIMKVNIRVAAALGITMYSFTPHLILTIELSHQLIAHAKLFDRLRPVIWDPTEPEMR